MPTEAPPEQPFFAQGIPVEIGKIQRELKKLWQDSHEAATRASRLNLVIYSDADSSLRGNTALVEQIARQHALRAILIAAKPKMGGHAVRAWVNAHCQVSKSGGKQRCSEQIAVQLEGDAARRELVPNIILGHLDSDLPMYLWRQGEFSDSPNEQLMAWVDGLIFDSADWPRPAGQFAIVKKLAAAAGLEHGLADLNWTRLAGLRLAVAQFFDAPGARNALAGLDAVEVTHAPGARTQAALFVGWLAAQLGWDQTGNDGAGAAASFEKADGLALNVWLHEGAGVGIGRVVLKAKDGSRFTVSRDAGSAFFNTCASGADGRETCQVLPVGPEETADLVSAELVHGGGHRVYLRALEQVEGMWGY